jgi:hypothetical protein
MRSELHHLLLPPCVSWPRSCTAPPGSKRRGVPRDPVRAGEGPGLAARHEPVRSGAAGRDAEVPGEGTAPAGRQLDGTRRSDEPGALAAKARRHRTARGQRSTACSLLRVGLVLSFGAVADVPDVAVRVGERTAVPVCRARTCAGAGPAALRSALMLIRLVYLLMVRVFG